MSERRSRVVSALCVTTLAAAVIACGCSRVLGPRATLGPGAILRGRGLYNDVISDTNNEQTLEQIVRARYGEASGLLSVASVTANLRVMATTNAQLGIGPSSSYQGNLVPLSAGVAYEENPTIAYVPVQGERYAKAILSPVGLDLFVLLAGIEHAPAPVIPLLVKDVNGLQNPVYGPPEARALFQASIDLLARLQAAGQATWTAMRTKESPFALVIHGYAPGNRDVVRALLRAWDLPESLLRGDRSIVLPLNSSIGRTATPALNVQTRSVHDLIEVAAGCVEVPAEHVALGLADPRPDGVLALRGLLRIESSPRAPSTAVLVAVRHRGYWFYIAAHDGPSKLAFRVLHTLLGLRLTEGVQQAVPTLTIPVSK